MQNTECNSVICKLRHRPISAAGLQALVQKTRKGGEEHSQKLKRKEKRLEPCVSVHSYPSIRGANKSQMWF